MKMPKVDNFLGCMSLETGGHIIGWYNAICDVFAIIIGASVVFIFSLINCDDFKDAVDEDGEPILNAYEKRFCSYGIGIMIVIGIMAIIFGVGFLVIAIFLHQRHMSKKSLSS